MGARPSSFKKGGGFLNGVAGMITGYQFTDEFNGVAFKPGKVNGKDKFHSLYFVLSVRVDGADEDVTTTLFAGGADDYEISDDGLTITPVEKGQGIGANTGLGKFVTSLCEGGFPESALPEDEINFEAIIGTRANFVQVKDEETTKKLGQRLDKKTGKKYDRQDLKIGSVIDLPNAKGKPNGAAKTPAGKGTKAAKGPDVSELAAQTVRDVVEAAGGSLDKKKLRMAMFGKLGAKNPLRDPAIEFAYANLESIEGIDFDGSTLSAAE